MTISFQTAINGNVSLMARFATPCVNQVVAATFRAAADHAIFSSLCLYRLSSLLVSHFLLDLQEAHQRKSAGVDADDPLYTLQSFNLRSVQLMPTLGSLGAAIDPAHYGPHGERDECFGADLAALPDSVASSEGEFGQNSRTGDESTIGDASRGGSREMIDKA